MSSASSTFLPDLDLSLTNSNFYDDSALDDALSEVIVWDDPTLDSALSEIKLTSAQQRLSDISVSRFNRHVEILPIVANALQHDRTAFDNKFGFYYHPDEGFQFESRLVTLRELDEQDIWNKRDAYNKKCARNASLSSALYKQYPGVLRVTQPYARKRARVDDVFRHADRLRSRTVYEQSYYNERGYYPQDVSDNDDFEPPNLYLSD